MPKLKIHLFGGFQVTLDEQPVHFRSDKVRALLAYLAIEGNHPLERKRLAQLLWADFRHHSGMVSLRTSLTNLRQELADLPILQTTYHTVQLNRHHPDLWCDAWLLEQTYASNDFSEERLQVARIIRKGEFLEGLGRIASQPFDEWLQTRRAIYRYKAQELQITALHASPLERPSYHNDLQWTLRAFVNVNR